MLDSGWLLFVKDVGLPGVIALLLTVVVLRLITNSSKQNEIADKQAMLWAQLNVATQEHLQRASQSDDRLKDAVDQLRISNEQRFDNLLEAIKSLPNELKTKVQVTIAEEVGKMIGDWARKQTHKRGGVSYFLERIFG